VVEFFDARIESLQRDIVEKHGFELVDHNMVLFVRRPPKKTR